MKDWRVKRKEKLNELTLGAHILAYLLAILTLIASTATEGHSFTTSSYLLMGTLLPATLVIFLDYQLMRGKYWRKFLLVWNIVKHSLLFALITGVLTFCNRETIWLFSSIFLLPVVLSSITLGQRWGMFFAAAAVGSIYGLSGGFNFAVNQVLTAAETALVHGGIYFLVSWFLGGIIEVEKETSERLYSLVEDRRRCYQELFELAPVGYLVTTVTGVIREANLAAEELLGVQKTDLEGKNIKAFVAPENYTDFIKSINQVRRQVSHSRQEFEAIFVQQGSSRFPAALTVEAEKNVHGKVTGLRWVLQDISLRQQAESAMREKELAARMKQERDLIARMMDTSPAGILVVDRNGLILYANARVSEIIGSIRSGVPATGKELEMIGPGKTIYGCLEKVFQNVIETKTAIYNDHQALENNVNGQVIYLSVSGAPVFNREGGIEQVVLTLDDITQQKKMSEEIIRADKLESLGLLAGGIAHDFNNFMAVMLGHISLMKLKNQNQEITDHLEKTEKAVLRARELTRKLFVFAKGGEPVRENIYLQNLLLETASFALSGSSAVCQTKIDENLWPVEADEAQIGQVINNILINAVQAMPAGGKIELCAGNIQVDPADGSECLNLPAGDYVRITISDEGEGIPQELMTKIFDPFFSTKPQGSGLGLATAHTIVQNHGGLIQVDSKKGMGTTFVVYLPASNKLCLNYQEDSEELYFGKGRVLVMDDEEPVLQVCGDMLKHLGKQVVFACDGNEAVEIYKQEMEAGNPFDVVIMDLTVPGGVGGKEAVKQLRSLDPGVKVIVSSGYSEATIITNYKEYGFSGCVNKPYRIKELSSALKKVMEN